MTRPGVSSTYGLNRLRSTSVGLVFGVCILLLSGTSCSGNPSLTSPAGDDLQRLVDHYEQSPPTDFEAFLSDVGPRIGQSNNGATNWNAMKPEDLSQTYRLAGVYARTRYQDEMLATLARLVAIPTFRRDGVPPHEDPAIRAMGQELERIARELGLEYYNRDNRIFEVVLRGDTEEEFGIYTHSDVVPALPGWGLDNGTELSPFEMKIVDGRIYGRGTEDDKCSIVSALYALHTIKESGIPLRRTVRLMMETTEETGGEGMEYFKQRYDLPEFNVVLDSSYPVVVAEKGYGTIAIRIGKEGVEQHQPHVERIIGASAANQIARVAIIQLSRNVAVEEIESEVQAFADELDDVTFELLENNGGVLIRVTGESAHASEPENGINPLPPAFLLVHRLRDNGAIAGNHYSAVAKLVHDVYGLSYLADRGALGEANVAYEHDFMGPLTLAVTKVDDNESEVVLYTNVRAPRGKPIQDLKDELEAVYKKWSSENEIEIQTRIDIAEPMWRNPRGVWIQNLLGIFSDVTGRESRPISAAGATTARQLPNGINFGPSMPDEKYRGHTRNEFKRVENFYLDLQMFTEMILRLGNLESME